MSFAKSQTKARIVRVKIDQGSAGLFYATSPDLRGLLVTGKTLPELRERIPVAITQLFEALDWHCTVIDAEGGDDAQAAPMLQPWIAIPAHVAAAAMAAGED